jgi:hypothetical protein
MSLLSSSPKENTKPIGGDEEEEGSVSDEQGIGESEAHCNGI